jgi:hypothetical protein
MVRLSKEVLARQTKTEIYFPDGGETLGNLIERFGPQAFLNIEYDYSDCSIQIIWMRTEKENKS